MVFIALILLGLTTFLEIHLINDLLIRNLLAFFTGSIIGAVCMQLFLFEVMR